MTKKITARQDTVLSFIRESIEERGYPPTIREIAAHLKITSLKAVDRHLTALEKKGRIKRTGGISRAIELIGSAVIKGARAVPIIGTVRAGAPNLAAEDIEGTVALDPTYAGRDGSFFLRVKGDSMIEAHIKEGDLALVRPTPDVRDGDIVVALIGDEATLKYFYKEPGGIRLQPANSGMDPIFVRSDEPQFEIIGKVITILRQLA